MIVLINFNDMLILYIPIFLLKFVLYLEVHYFLIIIFLLTIDSNVFSSILIIVVVHVRFLVIIVIILLICIFIIHLSTLFAEDLSIFIFSRIISTFILLFIIHLSRMSPHLSPSALSDCTLNSLIFSTMISI